MARLHHKNEYCHGVSVIFKHKFAYRLTQVYARNKSKNDLTLVKIFLYLMNAWLLLYEYLIPQNLKGIIIISLNKILDSNYN